eukprot:TCONS_00000293-protein
MSVKDQVKDFLEKFYDFDEAMRECSYQAIQIRTTELDKNFLLTGSFIEGAWAIPFMVTIDGKKLDKDEMRIMCTITKDISPFILHQTANMGYYDLKLKEDLIATTTTEQRDKIHEIMRIAETTKPENHAQPWNQYDGFFLEDVQEGRPSMERTINYNLADPESIIGTVFSVFKDSNYDNVPCLHLDFWPDIAQPWFEKERYWPKPEVMAEIHKKGCHLVWKSVNGEQASWRLSFSQAEVILARERSVFQKKCFLLAKLIFTVQTQHFTDPENDRKLPSYLIKTTMNLLTEETPQSVWKIWEEENNYFEAVENLFKQLSDFLKHGHMSCLFSEEMDLLRGFSQAYLNVMSDVFENFFKTDHGLRVLLVCLKESAICKIEAKFTSDFVNIIRKVTDAIENHLPELQQEFKHFQEQTEENGATKEALNEFMIRALEITGIYKLPLIFKIYRSIKSTLTWVNEWYNHFKALIFDTRPI